MTELSVLLGRLETDMWLSLETQRDQVRHIDEILSNLDSMQGDTMPECSPTALMHWTLRTINFRSPLPTQASGDNNKLTLTLIEYMQCSPPLVCVRQPLSSRFNTSWASCPMEWRPRLERYVLDLAEDPEGTALVEVLFRFNIKTTIVVVLKVRRTVAEDGKRIGTIVSSVCWVA